MQSNTSISVPVSKIGCIHLCSGFIMCHSIFIFITEYRNMHQPRFEQNKRLTAAHTFEGQTPVPVDKFQLRCGQHSYPSTG